MSWDAYQLLFRVETPLHIGWRRVGNYWRSRPYLPAYPLLCALAARLTESGHRFPGGSPDPDDPYSDTLAWLKQHVRLTYFFPALRDEGAGSASSSGPVVFLPRYRDDGSFAFLRQDPGGSAAGENSPGECPAAKFDYLFMDAQARTALSYPERTAQAGTLYHFEFLRPHTRPNGSARPQAVYLTGYILFDSEARKKLLEDVPEAGEKRLGALFDRLQVGGERRLGWGLLRLADKRKVDNDTMLFGLAGIKLNLTGEDRVELLIQPEATDTALLLAHTPRPSRKGLQPTGPVEIMLRRETCFEDGRCLSGTRVVVYGAASDAGSDAAPGAAPNAASDAAGRPLFLPGSRIKTTGRFAITEEGLWFYLGYHHHRNKGRFAITEEGLWKVHEEG